MAVITPPSVTALPTPPSTASPATFDALADAFLGALPTLQTETDALAANVAANATDAAASAVLANLEVGNAAAQAVAAAASAVTAAINAAAAAAATGASIWVSGTTYSIGDVRYSPTNQRVYRRKTAGAGTTDPSADPTNWALIDAEPTIVLMTGTALTAVAGAHYCMAYVTDATVSTLTLPATPASGDRVSVTWTNSRTTNVIARNGQTIMGLSEDMTLDASTNGTVQLRFVNSSWRIL